jgi:lipopolysaccharide transport system permease protein
MNPHAPLPLSPLALGRSVRHHRELLLELVKRDVLQRYRGSIGGVFWSLLQPVLALALFTFVFSRIFHARWPGVGEAGTAHVPIMLFAGMLLYTLLSENLTRATGLIAAHANYVKRVVFPLELLPLATALGIGLHALIQLAVWLLALILMTGTLHWGLLWAPLMLLPLFVLVLGLSWLLAATSVFVRDLAQLVPLLTSALAFLAPVFYPLGAVPEPARSWIALNPLSFVVEQMRAVVVLGETPQAQGWALYAGVALAVGWLGFVVFQRMRPGLADEL